MADGLEQAGMQTYQVMVHGRNVFMRDVDTGEILKRGFYTVMYIDAIDEERAVALAFDKVIKRLEKFDLYKEDNPPRLFIQEIKVVDSIIRELAPSEYGYAWYPEEETEEK